MTKVGYLIETSPLIYSSNHYTGFYMTGASFMKELKEGGAYFKVREVIRIKFKNFVIFVFRITTKLLLLTIAKNKVYH